jgi:hypothetical protein
MTGRRGKTDGTKAAGPTDGDNSHYAKAFKAAAKVVEAREKLRTATSTAMRTIQHRTIRKQSPKFEDLTNRDRAMTRLLAAFLRRTNPHLDAEGEIKRWLRGETDDMGTYAEFLQWCANERIRLDESELGRPLTETEARFVSDLDEIDGPDQRTIQYRLQNQFGAHGEPGKPGRPRKTLAKTER